MHVKSFFESTFNHSVWTSDKRGNVTIMWLFEDIFQRTKTIKISTDIMNEDNQILWSSMCSLVEILCILEEQIILICWQLLYDVNCMEIFEFNLPVNFLNFLSNWVKF